MTEDNERLLKATSRFAELIVTVHSARQLPKRKGISQTERTDL